MKKTKLRILSVFLSLCFCLTALPIGLTAQAEIHIPDPDIRNLAPHPFFGYFDTESSVLTTEFTTEDVNSRYFESFLLTDQNITTTLGTLTIKNIVYHMLGIMSYNSDDPSHVVVDKQNKKVKLSQEQYMPDNIDVSSLGEVFIAVQTEGAHDEDNWGEGSEISDPLRVTLPSTPPTPQNPDGVQVKLKSLEAGSIQTFGYGSLTGRIATMLLTFNKQLGVNHYFAAPTKANGEKALTGNMPFFHIYKGEIGWEGIPPEEIVYSSGAVRKSSSSNDIYLETEGPNGEEISQTPDTITVEMKVVQFDEAPQYPFMGYTGDEKVYVEVGAENPYTMESSDWVCVEVPLTADAVGQVFTPEQEDPLTNVSQISAEEIVKGNTITVYPAAEGGSGDIQFAVSYKKQTSNYYTTVTQYGDQSEVTFKPGSVGAYTVLVKAKDEKGTEAEKTFTGNRTSKTIMVRMEIRTFFILLYTL